MRSNSSTASEEVDLLALAAEEGARFDGASSTASRCSIRGDRAPAAPPLRNLIENAQRHGTPPVEVEVRPDRASRALRLTVSDAGPGIPLAERARVFEPFRRGRASEPSKTRPDAVRGTGLGLTLVRQIARRHGGDARIEGPDGTSRIMVTLPLPIATN